MKCPKCGNSKIVDSANGKKCVNCNFEWKPKKTGCFTWLVTIFVVIFVLPAFFGALMHNNSYESNNATVIHKADTAPATQTTAVAPTTSTAAPKDNHPQTWRRYIKNDEFNGNSNLMFVKQSEDFFYNNHSFKSQPSIIIRCKDNKTELYIDFDTTMTCHGTMKLGLKIDNEKPYFENWQSSTDCSGLFSPQPIKLIKKLKGHQKLVVKFVPFQQGDVNTTFNLDEINDVQAEIAETCKWPK